MTELTQKASSSRAIGEDWRQALSKSNSVGHQTGRKRQTTVRFEDKTLTWLERVQDTLEESFAETVRRVAKEGLTQIRDRQEVVLEVLENMHRGTTDPEVQRAVETVQEEFLKDKVELG